MKTCLRAVLENGQAGRLLDLSFVADDHEFGPSPDGTEIHIEGRGEFTVTRGTPYQDAPPEPPAVNGIPFAETIVREDGYVSPHVPPGAGFRATTAADLPSSFLAAAAEGLRRDALWRDPPPLADGCEHDLRVLPVAEFRQTVTCAKCGGLAAEASQELTANPSAFIIGDGGTIARKFEIRRRDPAEAAALIRAGYARLGIPQEIAEAMTEDALEQ